MVGAAACHQGIHRVFQRIHRGDQLRVGCGSAGKADNADVAARANLAVGPLGGFLNDIDKRVCASFHAGQRRTGHAARTVQHKHDVSGVGDDIRSGCQSQRDTQRPVAVDLVQIYQFIGIGNTHVVSSFWGMAPYQLMPVCHWMCRPGTTQVLGAAIQSPSPFQPSCFWRRPPGSSVRSAQKRLGIWDIWQRGFSRCWMETV